MTMTRKRSPDEMSFIGSISLLNQLYHSLLPSVEEGESYES